MYQPLALELPAAGNQIAKPCGNRIARLRGKRRPTARPIGLTHGQTAYP